MEAMDFSSFWVWLVAGAGLILLEVVTGSLFLLWPGVAALMFAAVAFFFPDLSIAFQIFAFAALTLALGVIGRSYLNIRPGTLKSDRPNLNERTQALIGRQVVASDDFTAGAGAVTVQDTRWSARLQNPADTVKKGDVVVIIEVEGSILVVSKQAA